jgi:toxin ParE1/3/4
MGESVPQYRPGLRRFTVGKYVLYYEPIQGGVRLVPVLHGARNIDDLFQ